MTTEPPTPEKVPSEPSEAEASAIQIAQLRTTQTTTTETTNVTATATTGRRQAFRDIRRQLEEEDLASKGVQKLLLAELETSDGECEALRGYTERYHEADKRAAVLEERLKSNTGMEIMFAVGLTIGGACIGLAPTLWDASWKGPIALAVGVLLVAGSGIAKAYKR